MIIALINIAADFRQFLLSELLDSGRRDLRSSQNPSRLQTSDNNPVKLDIT
jgi:hypothetical protein